MENFNLNYSFGTRSEREILPTIREYFGKDIKKSADKMAKHDFYDTNGGLYELRTRKFSCNKYPTTVVACDKYYCMTEENSKGRDLYFLFRFTDGLYYIKFTLQGFEEYKIDNNYCRNTPRQYGKGVKYDRPRPHVFIPIEHLTKINI